MIKKFLPLYIILIAAALFSVIFTFCSAKEYTGTVKFLRGELDKANVECNIDKGNIELTDLKVDEESVTYTVKPVNMGDDFLEITDKKSGVVVTYAPFYCGPFNTIFSYSPALDFKGSSVIIALIMAGILFVTVYMTVMYFYFLRKSMFSYTMVACGGMAVFGIVDIAMVYIVLFMSGHTTLVEYLNWPIGVFLQEFASFGQVFAILTVPFMAFFSSAVSISNMVLIRREGFSIFNLLGVILGVVWFFGMLVNLHFYFDPGGSSVHGRIYTTISNATAVILSYFICMLFSTVFSAWRASRKKPPYDRDFIVILGCAINKDGTLLPLLRGRVDSAIAFAHDQYEKTGKKVKFIPSGGQGNDEIISEAEAMKRYMLEQGIPEEQIITENRSANTFQNVLFSKKLIEKDREDDYNSAVSTTNYHVFRSYILSSKVGLRNMRGISAKTKWYFFPNAFLRELLGLIVDKKKMHFFLVALLAASFALINVLTFYG